jgi:hypothetical protein
VSKVLWPSVKGEQSPGYILQRTTWASSVQSVRHPVACALAEASSATLENRLRRGIFQAVLQRQLLGGWTGCPLPDGPFPRLLLLLRNVVTADLRRTHYFGGRLVERIAEATPASHLTQGRSNEDIPVKQCSYFQKQSSMFFTHQLGHALAHSCKCRRKEFERNPCQIQPSFAPSKSEFFPGPRPSSSSWGKVNGGT